MLFSYPAAGWGSRALGLSALAAGERSMASGETPAVPISVSMGSVTEALILTQLAGWHPLPVLQTRAAFLGCYLTPLSAGGVQEHTGLLGKMIFCKSKCTRPEHTVTLSHAHDDTLDIIHGLWYWGTRRHELWQSRYPAH